MTPQHFSSGHPLADRRADFAETLFSGGDQAAAAELLRDALALAEGWAAGWYRLGEMLEAAERLPDAVAAFARAIACDPTDRVGAELRLSLLADGGAETMPAAFVEALFDQYAPKFDAALTGRLGYGVPQLIDAALTRAGHVRASHALDLGCGTGLMGMLLRPRADRLDGSDLSRGMLARARSRGLYDALFHGDIATLPTPAAPPDLFVAADVFPYVGALDPVLAHICTFAAPSAWLAFSVEEHPGPEGMVLRPSRRFAHSRFYIEDLLERHGFAILDLQPQILRMDRGAPVTGLVVVAARQNSRAIRPLAVDIATEYPQVDTRL